MIEPCAIPTASGPSSGAEAAKGWEIAAFDLVAYLVGQCADTASINADMSGDPMSVAFLLCLALPRKQALAYKQKRRSWQKPPCSRRFERQSHLFEKRCPLRRYGVKGPLVPCGVWGETPQNKSNKSLLYKKNQVDNTGKTEVFLR